MPTVYKHGLMHIYNSQGKLIGRECYLWEKYMFVAVFSLSWIVHSVALRRWSTKWIINNIANLLRR